MIPYPLRLVADRLATALVALARRVEATVAPRPVAILLFCRLSALVRRCLRHSCNLPPRTRQAAPAAMPADPAAPKPEPKSNASDQRPRAPTLSRPRAPTLSRKRGWLRAALADDAAIIDQLAALLADPATAQLLARDPFLRRTLNPLLRILGLAAPAEPTSHPPSPSTPGAPPPNPPLDPRDPFFVFTTP